MTGSFQDYLEDYAELIIKVGLNYQGGRRIRIGSMPGRSARFRTPLEAAPLVRLLVKKAYQMGAPLVEVFWGDPELDLIRYQHASRESLVELPSWSVNELFTAAKRKDARIYIGGADPHKFQEIDSSILAEVQKARSETFREANEYLVQHPSPWIIVLYPSQDWAQAVFPELAPNQAVEELSQHLIRFYRLDLDDPLAYWKEHFTSLSRRADWLTGQAFQYIHLKSPGTDLKIRMLDGHLWKTALLKDQEGRENAVNMPSEEIFTVPDRMGVNGIVSSTKPFTISGGFVEGLTLEFKDGLVTKVQARAGEELVKNALEIDEGASRLGELALVPHSSPISQAGVIFHNILLDENASIHIALGRGIRECLKGTEGMTGEEFVELGGNHSAIHQDFMIGSGEINVDGIDSAGKVHPLMRQGEWAVDL